MAEVDIAQITGSARTVSQLLTNTKYGLDFYQREYGWEESQVIELIEDLAGRFLIEYDSQHARKQVSGYRPYFLGPIVTAMRKGVRYLVDGQQRLTTLTLLLIHVRNLLGPTEEEGAQLNPLIFSSAFGEKSFNLDVPERDKVMESILEGTPFDPAGESQSIQNLVRRYGDIVSQFPEELAEPNVLPYFKDWLTLRVVMVEISAVDQDMALEIFETMNDRGLRLSNTDMLKSFLLAQVREPATIEALNSKWRERILELQDTEKNADAEFLKTWLRGKFADTQRERRKAAAPGDFDIIGTAFHKWVRDNQERIGLSTSDTYRTIVDRDFMRMSRRYLQLQRGANSYTPGYERVFYNAAAGFTLQFLPILAAVTPDDDDATFQQKTRLVAGYLDIMLARRLVNFRNSGYSTMVYTIFNLAKDLRDRDPDSLREVLADRVADLEESFDGVSTFRLTGRNLSHVRYLLARITDWIETECGRPPSFAALLDRSIKHPYEVEHIWANHYERHTDEFDNVHAFEDTRDRFGDLLLLPKDFNASFSDKPYDEKMPQYFGQNLLAASLTPAAYQNNPSFLALIDRTGLPFRTHPTFRAADIDERQELYRQLCEAVWDPSRLGLDGGTPSAQTSTEQRRRFYDIDLAEIIEAGLLQIGETLTGTRSGQTFTATITPDRRLNVGTSTYDTLSAAANALTGKSNNGWGFWSAERSGEEVPLTQIRREYINDSTAGASDT